ncbi:MAG TPA: hypothetical protein DCX75_03730, partial [Brevundimonas sp.]|nr:hypothetical protein [Brevundimonas sp.]
QWRLDAETMAVTWSDEVYRIHGVERGAFDPSYDDAVGFYHPDDRAPLMKAIARGLETGEGYKHRMRLIRRDGAERLVLTHADTERGPDGKVTAMFGVFQDVTEQERIHDAVAASERAFRNLAEQTGDIIA